ncbi:Predicted acyl esterase [Prochlorococcus marinus str. MIT 9515]|uniref:Predicted acyl esterase n=1 Tax=Prochlorococcus marinus (strain MIT 9515) TaxID=167542 RepID=A2BVP8_PROM5|nr:CocE/NonD family hydrolase [Prochlorococcus marinus]ABM71859.1 Predicted acyl esterase [Prochlorococcus marinus str. MIT 9515]
MREVNWVDKSLRLNDGIELASRIWTPKGNGSWPALLMRQPYGREIASTITYSHPEWWASKGYMVVIQDVRGQGSSSGIFKGFSQEPKDTSETHQWVRSLKECNGKLGLYGFSYQGLTQLTGTKDSKPPDCLSPAMTGIDLKNHWSSDGGAFWWNNNIAWGLQIAALKMKRENNSLGWEEIISALENKSYLRKGLALLKKYDPNNFVLEWHKNINHDNDFLEIKLISSWLKKPMLIIGGLWDPHLRGAFDLYQKSKAAGGNPDIIIGDATHLNWWEGSQKTLLNFFDTHLKSDKEVKEKNFSKHKKIWNLSLKKWEPIEEGKVQKYKFGLESNGTANTEVTDGSLLLNSKGSGWFSIVNDPWRPSQGEGGHLGPTPGMFDRYIFDTRLDVGVFQTNSLQKDLQISGIPTLETSVKCDQKSFDICLALSMVNEKEKTVNQFSTGFLRVKNSKKNEKCECKIEMHPTNILLLKGSKLRLSISAAAYPAIGINSGSSDNNNGAPTINHKIITLSFELSKTFMKMNPFFN